MLDPTLGIRRGKRIFHYTSFPQNPKQATKGRQSNTKLTPKALSATFGASVVDTPQNFKQSLQEIVN